MESPMTKILFPPTETENPDREAIEFEAVVDGRNISCSVPYQILYDHFEAEYSDPLFAFMTCRQVVEQIVERRIRAQRLDADGGIRLSETDFAPGDTHP